MNNLKSSFHKRVILALLGGRREGKGGKCITTGKKE